VILYPSCTRCGQYRNPSTDQTKTGKWLKNYEPCRSKRANWKSEWRKCKPDVSTSAAKVARPLDHHLETAASQLAQNLPSTLPVSIEPTTVSISHASTQCESNDLPTFTNGPAQNPVAMNPRVCHPQPRACNEARQKTALKMPQNKQPQPDPLQPISERCTNIVKQTKSATIQPGSQGFLQRVVQRRQQDHSLIEEMPIEGKECPEDDADVTTQLRNVQQG
jgi:hypothetical protein